MPSPSERVWLHGDEARDWFFQLSPDAPHVWDLHIEALEHAFGPRPSLTFRALLDPFTNKPRRLIIQVDRPVDDAEAWLKAQEAQEFLVSRESRFAREGRSRRSPFEDIVIELVGEPARNPLESPLVDDD